MNKKARRAVCTLSVGGLKVGKNMLTREKSIENFDSATDELINSKYILADGKVSAVLKTVAQSRILYELFEYVTDGFDYHAAKSVCFVETGGKFKLPQKEEDLLALVFLLLMEIDAKREDLIDFCTKYFPSSEGLQKSYNEFASQVLVPFKLTAEKALARIISAQDDEAEEKSKEEKNSVAEVGGKKSEVKSEITRAALEKVTKEKNRCEEDDVEELAFILGKLADAIDASDYEQVTLAYTALKYAVKCIRRPKVDIKSIEKEISEL